MGRQINKQISKVRLDPPTFHSRGRICAPTALFRQVYRQPWRSTGDCPLSLPLHPCTSLTLATVQRPATLSRFLMIMQRLEVSKGYSYSIYISLEHCDKRDKSSILIVIWKINALLNLFGYRYNTSKILLLLNIRLDVWIDIEFIWNIW